ncbi:hypothetical protein TSOC_003705 [Tetrabaena socialis]|uniref:Uncharacterized protein n=1 Tax=Tetrabaena socialis TaxID=47790 RepID=A0A2J8AB47_9CHLO|nr:hypothetical protein TSOC_003705 [Tetrabaena socialis]|eukprot:PNH09693.1 hypothetical protein TSOC_003705 [Tetrabaena socialis]
MAKGLEQRRRLKRALTAARGNLHKIANGKGLPQDKPEAPKQSDVDRMPASLRKMLALKELAERHGKKGAGGAPAEGAGAQKGGRKGGPKASAKPQDGEGEEGPSTSGRQPDAAAAAGGRGGQRAERDVPQQRTGKGAGLVGGNPFTTEQGVQHKLKGKRKEYLKRKEEKKRAKGGGELVVEKELQLRDKVQFGEVVHAPLQVHLKRKHWAPGQERTANERCSQIFQKQMQQAQQRMDGAAVDEDPAVRSAAAKAGGGGAKAGGGGAKAGGGVKAGSAGAKAGGAGAAEQKGKKRKAPPMDEETEALRQQFIDSYRAAKKGGGSHHAAYGGATLTSLAQLVGTKVAPATYTLA